MKEVTEEELTIFDKEYVNLMLKIMQSLKQATLQLILFSAFELPIYDYNFLILPRLIFHPANYQDFPNMVRNGISSVIFKALKDSIFHFLK